MKVGMMRIQELSTKLDRVLYIYSNCRKLQDRLPFWCTGNGLSTSRTAITILFVVGEYCDLATHHSGKEEPPWCVAQCRMRCDGRRKLCWAVLFPLHHSFHMFQYFASQILLLTLNTHNATLVCSAMIGIILQGCSAIVITQKTREGLVQLLSAQLCTGGGVIQTRQYQLSATIFLCSLLPPPRVLFSHSISPVAFISGHLPEITIKVE